MKKFETGKTYTCRSLCDYNCIFSFKIIKRTQKTVTIKALGKIVSRKIEIVDNIETISPLKKYSMSPVLRAI